MIVDSILSLIGNTPLVKLGNINDSDAIIYAKLESFNPLASIKDRAAFAMIEAAENEGKLTNGSVIIEATSGNTGIGLAYIGSLKGYKVILTMPDTMSIERQKLLKALGAEVVLTDGKEGMNGAIKKAQELSESTPNSFIPQQFSNPANPLIHEKTTGPEIWNDTNGKIDILVAGVGTGGTISGAGKFLKSKNSNIKIIAVEPSASPVLSGGQAGAHKIQGIGAGFIPNVYNAQVVDEIFKVNEKDALNTTRRLIKDEGIFAGFSSGAAVFAALEIAKNKENTGKIITVILPDSGERYLSTWF